MTDREDVYRRAGGFVKGKFEFNGIDLSPFVEEVTIDPTVHEFTPLDDGESSHHADWEITQVAAYIAHRDKLDRVRAGEALNPNGVHCTRCGEVAQGWATANGQRLCHGETRDCYTIVTSHYTPRHHIEPTPKEAS